MLVTKGGEKGGITSSDGSMTYFTQAQRHSELELFAAVKGLEENGFISSLNSELKFKELGEIPATRSPIENVYQITEKGYAVARSVTDVRQFPPPFEN
jgi:hypothetical protein